MALQPDLLFAGITTSPAREFAAQVIAEAKPERVLLPCAGRFASTLAIIAAGVPADRIQASDVSLFSSVIGVLADPEQDIDQLAIEPAEKLEPFLVDAESPIEWAAGLLVGLKWADMVPKTLHSASQRRQVWQERGRYRNHVTGLLKDTVDRLAGIHYEQADVRDVAQEMADAGPETALYVNMPGYARGYSRMYGKSEDLVHWAKGVRDRELDPSEVPALLDQLHEAAGLVVAYTHHGHRPAEWTAVFANELKGGRIDYLVTNWDVADRFVHSKLRDSKPPRHYPIYGDQEINPDSTLSIVKVDRDTGLYYRDLFVHKLGTTQSERYYLLLVDGRVITSFGLHRRDYDRGVTPYLGETFGITIGSKRYKRLGKLFMRALTSGDMLRLFIASEPRYAFHPPQGIKTSSVTTHPEGKTDRGVMQLIHREQLPFGNWRVVYVGDFRDDTWPDVLAWWCENHARYVRPGWEEEATVA